MHGLNLQEATQTMAAYNINLQKNQILLMKDSGSNTHLIIQRDIKYIGIPDLVKERPGRLNGIGQSPTLGMSPLVLSIQSRDNKRHIHIGKPAIIISNDTGPGCSLISETILEREGYTWQSSSDTCTLTTPDGYLIDLTRNEMTSFWFLIAITDCKLAEQVKEKIQQTASKKKTFITTKLQSESREHALMRIPKMPLKCLPQSIQQLVERTHRAAGHVNLTRLKEIADKNLATGLEFLRTIPDPTDALITCDACALGKQKRNPAPKLTTEKIKHPIWGAMHIDSTGLMKHASIEGHRYGLIAVHAASTDDKGSIIDDGGIGYSILVGLQHKSDTPLALNKIFTIIGPPKRLHSDNASEFISSTANSLYAKYGISHTTIPPYTPYANGKAERAWGTIKGIARTIMLEAGTPPSAWYLALAYANLIKNKTSLTPKADMTQYEAYHGTKPNFADMFPFGCLCYVLLTHEQQLAQGIDHSFGPRALTGIYMGQHVIHGMTKHIILTSNAAGHIHIATTFNNLKVSPDIYPGRPTTTIPIIEAQNTLHITVSEEMLYDTELTPQIFLAHMKIARMKQKQLQAMPATRAKTNSLPQSIKKIDKMISTKVTKPPKDLPKGWYEVDRIVAHRGPPSKREYLIRWKDYTPDDDSWSPSKDVRRNLIDAYNKELANSKSVGTSGQTIRLIPQDLLDGDYRNIDPFEESSKPLKDKPITDPLDFKISIQPEDWKETLPHKGATYTYLTPQYTYIVPNTKDKFVGRHIRTFINGIHEIARLISSNGNEWQAHYADGEMTDIDAEQLDTHLIHYDNSTLHENINDIIKHSTTAAQTFAIEDNDEPKGMKKIMLHKESTAILESIQKEVQAFTDMDVFDEISYNELPKGQQTLPSHIIVKRKYTIDPKTGLNTFNRWKARLVFNGKNQKDHGSTYSPTPYFATIRTILATCCTKDWVLLHLDLGNAFCGTKLIGRNVYVKPPPDCAPPNKLWRIKKSVYGLKDSNREFYNAFKQLVLEFRYSESQLRFKKSQSEPCMYILHDNQDKPLAIMIGYVDDLIVADKSDNQTITKELIKHLQTGWSVTLEGQLERFLGVHFKRGKDGSWSYDCSAYITKSAEKFNQHPIPKDPTTPFPCKFSIETADWDNYKENTKTTKHYQSCLGVLIYAVTCGRPDIAYHVSAMSQFLTRPTPKLIDAAYRVMGYLLKTKEQTITYRLPSNPALHYRIYAACDAGWAGCTLTRRSQQGYVLWYNGGPISWRSNRQETVALSTAEAELISLVTCGKEVRHKAKILGDLGYPQRRNTIMEDNRAAIALTEQNMSHNGTRTKHMDLKYKWIEEQVEAGTLVPQYTPTNLNPADIFTKNLPRETFNRLLKFILEPAINPTPPESD